MESPISCHNPDLDSELIRRYIRFGKVVFFSESAWLFRTKLHIQVKLTDIYSIFTFLCSGASRGTNLAVLVFHALLHETSILEYKQNLFFDFLIFVLFPQFSGPFGAENDHFSDFASKFAPNGPENWEKSKNKQNL